MAPFLLVTKSSPPSGGSENLGVILQQGNQETKQRRALFNAETDAEEI